jgi:hypothetical protein
VATQNDVRRIALSLDGVTESPDDFRFFVADRQFLWLWQERVDPKKARVPNPQVLVVRVASDIDKQVILAMDRKAFFTEPHYDGYNAVLVRLPKIRVPALRDLITQSCETARSMKPARARRPSSRRATRRGA